MVQTRSGTAQIVQFDPEPERTLHRQRREVTWAWDCSLQGTSLQNLFANEGNMELELLAAGRPLRESLEARATDVPNCIVYPEQEEGDFFEIRHHMLEILRTFRGLPNEDANIHIAKFIVGCNNILIRGFSAEAIKLRLFPFTLKDKAETWLFTLPANSITTWQQLHIKFLNKYYPASKTLNYKREILTQKPNEEFHEAWERYKEMYIKCPHVKIDLDTQMNIFFDWLNPTSKSHVNASVGGSLSNKSAREAFELFDMMATESQQWAAEHSQKRGIFELSVGSPNMSAQMEKMDKKIDAKFDMLLQHIASSTQQPPTSTVCTICSVGMMHMQLITILDGGSNASLPAENFSPKSHVSQSSSDSPLLSVILRMDSVARVSMLRKCINAIEAMSTLSRNDCLWLFSLCAVVDTPLDADTSASLRSLLRRCAALRAAKYVLNDEVVMLNILATILGRYFGQSEN
ncbi:hypothetical protein L3X38_003712 [Prunus dulcis]|uniref:Retrotransposon gag domain-containing protein n=1 Tax=Prunus dulcis TaxID=3755 RepID=A0AAD5F2C1_PRUDU|nr:hypothetical protein L3X38_003712 [Prunus dulcis]